MGNFNERLESALKQDKRFVSDEGDLLKNEIITAAYKIDDNLIVMLLSDDIFKNKFFKKIKGSHIFDILLFVDYVQDKNFLIDSYTKFKNKIGLTIDGKTLKERGEVVLVWPFKDCILEGGMDNGETQRKEIFFNRILAQDEITRLCSPKVLTNGKKYDAKGKKLFDKFNRDENGTITDNLIIKGNNLMALHSLYEEFAGKVKLIYIDPPYNTGSDSFKYNDNFNHSTWLTFIENRIQIAKKLLREDGAIFVQCDDNEQAYLRVLMDEILNFKECITVKTSTPSGVNAVNVKRGEQMFKLKEYLLFYSKSSSYRFYPQLVKSNFKPQYKYKVIKENDKYKVSDLSKEMSTEKLEAYCLSNSKYIFSLQKNNKKAGEKVKEVIKESENNDDVIEHYNSRGKLVLIYNGGVFVPLEERIIEEDGEKCFGVLISDFWDDEIFQTSSNEGGVNFNNGKKPEKLLKRIINLSTKKGDIVLDYHLGSGTTTAVAHKMGRQYIGIEQMHYIEDYTLKRMESVINGENTGISKTVEWQGGGEFIYFELKEYNQEFVSRIQNAKNSKELSQIWKAMKEKSFLDYNVDFREVDLAFEEWKKLEFEKQQMGLIELLDKNHLYVNRSEIDDTDFACTDAEKQLTKEFYQK